MEGNEFKCKYISHSNQLLCLWGNNSNKRVYVSMSHKAGDAATLFNFVNDWATMNQKPSQEGEVPSHTPLPSLSLLLLDARRKLASFPRNGVQEGQHGVQKGNMEFKGSKIESLIKAMVSSHNVQNPTRVEL